MSDLAFHINSFCPAAEGDELQERIALLKARDYAAALKPNMRSDWAYDLSCAAHEAAGHFVYAQVPTNRLKIAVNYCRNLVQAAMLADHLEGEAQ